MSSAPAPAPTSSSGLEPNICGMLCWIPLGPVPLIASIVFLLADPYKQNKFIRFHAFQQLLTAAAATAIGFGLMVIGAILALAGPLALLMFPVWLAYGLGVLGLMIYICLKAYGMQSPRLPFVGDLAAKYSGM